MKGILARLITYWGASRRRERYEAPERAQARIWQDLIKKARHTAFGREYDFASIRSYEDYKARVPVRDFESFRAYIDRIIAGEKDVLWPARPMVFAKTSGTTSGVKYIPVTKESMSYHLQTAGNIMFNYLEKTGKADIFKGKFLYITSSPDTKTKVGGLPCDLLSGLVNHYIPAFVYYFWRLPSRTINAIEDFDKKLDATVVESHAQDVRCISGMTPWIQQYFRKLLAYTGKQTVCEVFPNLSLIIQGGALYAPYRSSMNKLLGKHVDVLEVFPASEGFFAYQDRVEEAGMLLITNTDIFYEFIPFEQFSEPSPPRLRLGEVDTKTIYVLVVSNSSGLWSFVVGDTIRFIDTNPYRISFVGRTHHYISVFAEHVVGEDVNRAMTAALEAHPEVSIQDFTVAAQISTAKKRSAYEWWIEFRHLPQDMESFTSALDETLQRINPKYYGRRQGKIIERVEVIPLQEDAFVSYLKSENRYTPQHKIPKLSNDRVMVDKLVPYQILSDKMAIS